MTDPGAQKQYLLPEGRSDQIFHDHIVPLRLSGGQPQDTPLVVVITGQAGSGKTSLTRVLADRFADRGGVVHVDVDAFKTFHPEFRQLLLQDEGTADDLVHADARRWFERSLNHLAARRVNVLVEHGLRDAQVTDALLSRFAAAGYRIEAVLLATPAAQSRLAILNRYQVAHEKTGFGRYVPPDLHDQRYRHLLAVADTLDADPRVAAVSVHRRGGERVYHNERDPAGHWLNGTPTRDQLLAARNKPWSLPESAAFLRLHNSLTARMAAEWRQPLHSAHASATPLLHPDANRGPTRSTTAVTFGRYQLVSIAHLDTVRTILRDWPRVVVGVLDQGAVSSQQSHTSTLDSELAQASTANWAPERNPMSIEERVTLWQAAVDEAGLADRVEIRAIPRVSPDPEFFNQMFPPDRYDLVFPAPSGDGFDAVRNDRFAELLQRAVHTVEPPLEYHTSDIRAAYRRGSPTWRQALAPGTLGPFTAVNGPERLLAAPVTNPPTTRPGRPSPPSSGHDVER